jgi:hypothetical protein
LLTADDPSREQAGEQATTERETRYSQVEQAFEQPGPPFTGGDDVRNAGAGEYHQPGAKQHHHNTSSRQPATDGEHITQRNRERRSQQ